MGELLVQRGWITGEQLIRAIQSQRAQGGRIGTCLLELDALSEERLLDALAQQLGAPSVDVDQLEAIDDDVLSLVSQDLAARCRAVPVEADGDEIRVAALNADDLSLLKLLAPDTGRRIRPMVAHEVRILEALRRHYGVEVPGRYVPLIQRLNQQRSRRAASNEKSSIGNQTARVDVEWTRPERALEPRPASSSATGGTRPNPNRARPTASTTAPSGSHRSGQAGASTERPATAVPAATTPAATALASLSAAPPARSLDALAQQLAQLQDTQAIGTALFTFLGRSFPRRALLKVHDRKALGWLAGGEGLDKACFADLEIDLNEPSVFAEMNDGFPLHRGPVEGSTVHTELARCWQQDSLSPCVVLPIWVRDRLIGILYGDRGDAGLGDVDLDELEGLSTKAGLAFEICILRRKLLRRVT